MEEQKQKITYINILLAHHNRLSSDSPTTAQKSQLGSVFFDFTLSRAFDFNKKLTQNIAIIILYYQKTIFFLLVLIDHMLSIAEYVLKKHKLRSISIQSRAFFQLPNMIRR